MTARLRMLVGLNLWLAVNLWVAGVVTHVWWAGAYALALAAACSIAMLRRSI